MKKVAVPAFDERRRAGFYAAGPMSNHVRYRPIRFESVRSTNDVVLDAASAGAEPGLVVWSRIQTGGKGRKGRDWASPPGGLWASVLLDAEPPSRARGLIPLAVGCACCRALDDLGADVELRWPNDLMRADAKLGGILVETRSDEGGLEDVVAGIGINVENEPPLEGARNLADLSPAPQPGDVLDSILACLPEMEDALREGDADRICRVFMEHAWGMGRRMLLDGEPVVPKEIAVDGALIVEDEHGEVAVHRTGSLRPP